MRIKSALFALMLSTGLAMAQGPEVYVQGAAQFTRGQDAADVNFPSDWAWNHHPSARTGIGFPSGPVTFLVDYTHFWGYHPDFYRGARGKYDLFMGGVAIDLTKWFAPDFRVGAARVSAFGVKTGPWEARAAWEGGATLFKYRFGRKTYIREAGLNLEEQTTNRASLGFRVAATKIQALPISLGAGLVLSFRP